MLWKKYREGPDAFFVAYQRSSPRRISPAAKAAIERELFREKALVEDPELPISGYNYPALRDRLKKQGLNQLSWMRRFTVRRSSNHLARTGTISYLRVNSRFRTRFSGEQLTAASCLPAAARLSWRTRPGSGAAKLLHPILALRLRPALLAECLSEGLAGNLIGTCTVVPAQGARKPISPA